MPPVPAHLAAFLGKLKPSTKFAIPRAAQFPRISMGDARFTAIDDNGNETLLGLNSFEFIVIDGNENYSKIYYANPYDPGSSQAPDCWSDNGRFADIRVSNPVGESCALCPMNRWGSAKSAITQKETKACSDYKKLAVFPIHDDLDGDVFQFRLSPASLRNWGDYVIELQKTAESIGFEDLPPSMVITRVKWDKDRKNVALFEMVDFVDEDTAQFILDTQNENKYQTWIGSDIQSQSVPQLTSVPRDQHQRLGTPTRALQAPSKPVDAEYEDVKTTKATKPRLSGLGKAAKPQDREAPAAQEAKAPMSALERAKAKARAEINGGGRH